VETGSNPRLNASFLFRRSFHDATGPWPGQGDPDGLSNSAEFSLSKQWGPSAFDDVDG
jgi:hypothetical protein